MASPTYSDFIVYADESGDHSLTSIDADYPIFVLDFCIFQKKSYFEKIVPALQAFKFRHFGHDIVVLHEQEFRKQRPPFKFLQVEAKRKIFMEELTGIIAEAEFTVIASVIDKRRLVARYANPDNPYSIALKFCMERCFRFLREQGQLEGLTHLVFEQRGNKEDKQLELEFRRICDGNNQIGAMPNFEIAFADKKSNSAGLQLADLTARPIGLSVLRPGQPNQAFDLIRTKLRRGPNGQTQGFGLKVFP